MIDMAYRETAEVAVNQHKTKTVRKEKPLRMMAIDSAIIGGIAFFAAWTGEFDGSLIAAVKGFGAAFVIQFAIERGLKK